MSRRKGEGSLLLALHLSSLEDVSVLFLHEKKTAYTFTECTEAESSYCSYQLTLTYQASTQITAGTKSLKCFFYDEWLQAWGSVLKTVEKNYIDLRRECVTSVNSQRDSVQNIWFFFMYSMTALLLWPCFPWFCLSLCCFVDTLWLGGTC